jgi:hypothetical protein
MFELLTFDFSRFHRGEHGGAMLHPIFGSPLCDVCDRLAVALAKTGDEEIPEAPLRRIVRPECGIWESLAV